KESDERDRGVDRNDLCVRSIAPDLDQGDRNNERDEKREAKGLCEIQERAEETEEGRFAPIGEQITFDRHGQDEKCDRDEDQITGEHEQRAREKEWDRGE